MQISTPTTQDTINGLICLAICDSIGNKFEFLSKSKFKPQDIIDHAQSNEPKNITDDTQMTLFGFDAMLNNRPFADSYLDWYTTQTKDYIPNNNGLMSFEELYHQRDPGFTCMNSLHHLQLTGEIDTTNNSCGCGAIMRLLPLTLCDFDDKKVRESIEVTHHHEENIEAANLLIAAYTLTPILSLIKNTKNIEDFGNGYGWTSLSCVQMALWAVHNSRTFDELLINSIHHDGDSDSVAAVAGSIWGMIGNPYPAKYYSNIVEKSSIDYIVSKLRLV